MSQLDDLLKQDPVDMSAVERFLDGLDHQGRVQATRTLARRLFAPLFAAAGHKPMSPDSFVPEGTPPLSPVVHEGINNLPTFRGFKKVLFRDEAGALAGRNDLIWEFFSGPGYYVVEPQAPGAKEIVLDYTRLPAKTPAGWPALRGNDGPFSSIVFGGLRDTMRFVSKHVSIGRVSRRGKEKPQYFILVREPG